MFKPLMVGLTLPLLAVTGHAPEELRVAQEIATGTTPLSATIDGPDEAPPSGSVEVWCMWRVTPSGGQEPYTFNWHETSGEPYEDAEFWEKMPEVSAGWTRQWVKVTDANSDYVVVDMWFYIDSSAQLDMVWCELR
ncbi:MAG TPA: hypothetical protein VMN60_11060 [Longimicrobiales bacterium]|nr:hypothetical protein [Longimicrobiales bacterium]